MALQRPEIGHTAMEQHCNQQPEGHISDGQSGRGKPSDIPRIPVLRISILKGGNSAGRWWHKPVEPALRRQRQEDI